MAEAGGKLSLGVDGSPSHALLCPRQDVDECQLFQSSPQTRLCLHDCVNLPGSYRCLCPPGYLLHADRNACEGESSGGRAGSIPQDRGCGGDPWGTAPLTPRHRCRRERVRREAAQLHPGRPVHQHLRGPPLRAPQVPPAAPQHQLRQDLCLVSTARGSGCVTLGGRVLRCPGDYTVSPSGSREGASQHQQQIAVWGAQVCLARSSMFSACRLGCGWEHPNT